MPHIVEELALVDPAICPSVLTLALCTIIDIVTLVVFAIGLRQHSSTMSLAIDVLSFVFLPVGPSVNTDAIVLVVGEFAHILCSIWLCQTTLPMPVIIQEVAFVNFAIGPNVPPETVLPVVSERALEKMALSVDLFPLPFKELILDFTDMLST